MDKALIKMDELMDILEILVDEKSQISEKIIKLTEMTSKLDYDIDCLEENNQELLDEKIRIEEAPQKIKKEKIDLIKSIIIGYIMLTLVALMPTLVEGYSYILPCVGVSTLITGIVSGMVLPVQFKTINKKYSTGTIDEVEAQILENNKEIAKINEKKRPLNEEFVQLEQIRKNLETKIHNIEKDIEHVRDLRLRVILDYCTKNLELEEKINVAYEDDIKKKIK